MFNHRATVAARKGKRVLIIADRRELIQQAWQRLWNDAGIHAGIVLAGYPTAYQLPVQIGSIQTLNRRNLPPDIDIVIIDEARGSVSNQYKPIFERYHDRYFLGVDATPIRTSGQGFDHLYNHMVHGPSIRELEALGSLVPARCFINPLDPRILDRVKVTAGDYNEKQLAEAMENKAITADLVASKIKHAPGLKTITFAVSIEHSKMIIEQYREAGISAVHIDGDMKHEDRARIFKDFKNDKFEVLCNVGIACYGFDEPSIKCVQLARPTKSLALFLQQVGRGTRPFHGKENYLLLDHANCILEHGLPNSDRRWTLYGSSKEPKTHKQFRIKIDGKERVVDSSDWPVGVEGLELQEVTDIDIRLAKFDAIHEEQMRRAYKPLWSYFQYLKKYPDPSKEELMYIEHKLNFRHGWWRYKLKEIQEKRSQAA